MQSDKLIEVTSQSYIAFFTILYSSTHISICFIPPTTMGT